MTRLLLRTPAAWAEAQIPHADELLVEQSHLEKKAAAGALSFLFRYPDAVELLAPLSELAREELEHFERAVALAARRGLAPRRMKPGPYAERLVACVRVGEPERMLDQMLVSAVIEARSAERMHLLADALAGVDPELSAFWGELVVSEARHQALYLDLARGRFGVACVERRLAEVAAHEAEVLCRAEGMPRLHDGPPLQGPPLQGPPLQGPPLVRPA